MFQGHWDLRLVLADVIVMKELIFAPQILVHKMPFWIIQQKTHTFEGPVFFLSSFTLTPLAARLKKKNICNAGLSVDTVNQASTRNEEHM